MMPRILLAGLTVACAYSAFAQSTAGQTDLPKQQIDQSKAETGLKKSQTGLTELQKKQVKVETGKTTSEGVSAAVQANIDQNVTLPVIEALLIPAVGGLGAKVEIETALANLLGTDNVREADVLRPISKLSDLIVPQQVYRVDDLRKTVLFFVSTWGSKPSSPAKEAAVGQVLAEIDGQLSRMTTRNGQQAQIAMSVVRGSVTSGRNNAPTPQVVPPSPPVVVSELPVRVGSTPRITSRANHLVETFQFDDVAKPWYRNYTASSSKAPWTANSKVFRGRYFRDACPAFEKAAENRTSSLIENTEPAGTWMLAYTLKDACLFVVDLTDEQADETFALLDQMLLDWETLLQSRKANADRSENGGNSSACPSSDRNDSHARPKTFMGRRKSKYVNPNSQHRGDRFLSRQCRC